MKNAPKMLRRRYLLFAAWLGVFRCQQATIIPYLQRAAILT